MTTTEIQQLPFYAKFAFILVILISLGFLFYIGQSILSPLLLALLFAILLRPVTAFFTDKLHLPNVLASLISVVLFSFVFVAIFYFITIQVADMADDWGKIKRNLNIHYNHLQSYVTENFNFSKREQDAMVDDATSSSAESGKEIIGITLVTFTDTLLTMVLIPIYMFLILLYRTHFTKFFSKLFHIKYHGVLQDVITTIKISVQSYILGLLIELLIVSGLTTAGLLFLGVEYAILLGVITGLLNLIPYIGILIAGLLTIIASLTGSSELSVIIGIVVVNVVVQIIDNNLLVPWVVSSKVEINPLASIVGIVIGGGLGGVSGMFLAIPIMAMMKVIFDRIESLEAWGYLLGDDLPRSFRWRRKPIPKE
ncbi:AI-2E family transporter [Flavobacterium sp.]|uniref:AI-2E family transporter n=1 Tax=Flavobacterium sp. TaxID=239 RepID=UPI00391AF38E